MSVRTHHKCLPYWTPRVPGKRGAHSVGRTASMVETAALGDIVSAAGGVAASLMPGVLGDIVRTLTGDARDLVELNPSFIGLVRLGVRSAR